MSRKATSEYIGAKRRAYADADRTKRKHILDEVCEMTGYECKYANRLLTGNRCFRERKGRGKTYVGEVYEVPDLAVVRARAVWLEVVKDLRGSATALMERLDALTDPERVEGANMLAGWRTKYEYEITARMKSRWWRRMTRKRDVG